MTEYTEHSLVADLVSNELDTIEPHETVRSAQRRMESQTLRSLIVVDATRPVGVVKWRDIRTAGPDEPVSTYMDTRFPVLQSTMQMTEANVYIGDVDFDNIPVVDENGALVGEVPRSSLIQTEISASPADAMVIEENPMYLALQPGMNVVDAEGSKLGTLSEMVVDPTVGRISQIVVEHGLIFKKHRRVPADTINNVNDEVVLGITKMEWDYLADIEDQDTV